MLPALPPIHLVTLGTELQIAQTNSLICTEEPDSLGRGRRMKPCKLLKIRNAGLCASVLRGS
jgi:hypothetical protein